MLKVFVISSKLAAQLDVGIIILCKNEARLGVQKVEEVLGPKDKQLRDGLLTEIHLGWKILVMKGYGQSRH